MLNLLNEDKTNKIGGRAFVKGCYASCVPHRMQAYRWLTLLAFWALCWVRENARLSKGQLTLVMNTINKKAVSLLGWSPRSTGEAIRATAESLIRLGIVK